ncbi:hypothetical protein Tco_0050349 [Tanacetum coccineum]
MAHELINQIKQQEERIAEGTSNKRKWEGDHTRDALANNKTKSLSARSTTLARVQQNVAIANGLVIKLDIVRPQSSKQNKFPQWQNRKLKLHVMSVEC